MAELTETNEGLFLSCKSVVGLHGEYSALKTVMLCSTAGYLGRCEVCRFIAHLQLILLPFLVAIKFISMGRKQLIVCADADIVFRNGEAVVARSLSDYRKVNYYAVLF